MGVWSMMDRPRGARFWRLSAPWLRTLRMGWGLPLMVLTEMLGNEGVDVLTWQLEPST